MVFSRCFHIEVFDIQSLNLVCIPITSSTTIILFHTTQFSKIFHELFTYKYGFIILLWIDYQTTLKFALRCFHIEVFDIQSLNLVYIPITSWTTIILFHTAQFLKIWYELLTYKYGFIILLWIDCQATLRLALRRFQVEVFDIQSWNSVYISIRSSTLIILLHTAQFSKIFLWIINL